MEFKITVNNCPDYAKDHAYIIARTDGMELWFYGAFDDKKEACRIQKELGENSIIIPNKNTKPAK